jgi:hypothetical protein
MKSGFSRRDFLRIGAAGSLGLGLTRLALPRPARAAAPAEAAALPGAAYGDWRDVYRDRWTSELVVYGTHTNTNCVSSCAWRL